MTTRLELYNLTLAHLRERKLGSLTQNCEPRRVLDDFYDQAVREAIEAGLWNCMLRSMQIDASTTIIPQFGWLYAFEIPDDWVRTVVISSEETLTDPLLDYNEEAGIWFANFSPLFVKYVSNGPQYGGDLGRWTGNFTAYVSLLLAEYACGRVTGATTLLDGPNGISKRLTKARTKAKSNDAMNQPPGQMPTGTWARSRRGFTRGVPMPGGSGPGSFDD